ncbi:MAG: type II secretion system protein [Campylobacterales bacterium]|nr:type II secretion system protein [Campylobacterales bacterium]
MQTKIRLLTRPARRGGFALITAVALMLLISILLLKMLAFTADTQQRTVNDYLVEQAILLTYSATEYAVLAISGRNRADGCITTVNATYPENGADKIFDITTTIRYVWSSDQLDSLPPSCKNAALYTQVSTPESNGAALIDVVVTSATDLRLDEPIRFHRRTLQKL